MKSSVVKSPRKLAYLISVDQIGSSSTVFRGGLGGGFPGTDFAPALVAWAFGADEALADAGATAVCEDAVMATLDEGATGAGTGASGVADTPALAATGTFGTTVTLLGVAGTGTALSPGRAPAAELVADEPASAVAPPAPATCQITTATATIAAAAAPPIAKIDPLGEGGRVCPQPPVGPLGCVAPVSVNVGVSAALSPKLASCPVTAMAANVGADAACIP